MPFRVRCGSCETVYYSGEGHECVKVKPIAVVPGRPVRLATAKPRTETIGKAVAKVEQEKRVASDARKAKKAARKNGAGKS